MGNKNKTVIVIAGPTAVGKTAAAISIAQHFNTRIISADSRQCYKELNIGVARPSGDELAQVKHYFIATHSIHQKINAVAFENYALEKAEEIFREKEVAVMVGGTGLYIKAFTEGMDEIPEVSEETHKEIIEQYKQQGLSWLQGQVQQFDPQFYERGEIQNPQRLMRALEVFKSTGKSIISFRKGKKAERDFRTIKIALELPKEELHHNIETRTEAMMSAGLTEEARSLLPCQHLTALQTVGYKELFRYVNNQTGFEEAVEAIKKNTRQYAKRQMTWFKKDKDFTWCLPKTDLLLSQIEKKLKGD